MQQLLGIERAATNGGIDLFGIFSGGFHAVFEGANPLTQTLAQLREFLRSKDKQGDCQDDK